MLLSLRVQEPLVAPQKCKRPFAGSFAFRSVLHPLDKFRTADWALAVRELAFVQLDRLRS